MCNINELEPILGGNIGIAFSGLVLSDLRNKISNRVYILEISSFQMDRIKHFKPNISIFLNILSCVELSSLFFIFFSNSSIRS